MPVIRTPTEYVTDSGDQEPNRPQNSIDGTLYVTARPYAFMLLSIVLLVFCGCATRVAPGAEAIIVTRNASDVEGCKPVGNVEAHPPYYSRNDDLRQLRNQALPMGATAIFITHRVSKATGIAYRCEEK